MSPKKTRYSVYSTEEENFIWDDASQSEIFRSLEACKKGIQDDLDEPESENLDTGKINTKRTDGRSEKDYIVFIETSWQLVPYTKRKKSGR